MSEHTAPTPEPQTPAHSGDERFNHIIAMLIASVTVLAATVTYLQTGANAQAAQAGRDAQRYAIQAMGRKTSGQAQVSYDWQGAYQAWAELNDLALSSDTVGDAPAAERYRRVRDRLIELSPLLQDPYFDPSVSDYPDTAAYESSVYLVETTELSERYTASAVTQNAWSDRSSLHIVQLTLFAVSLALYGLSTTLARGTRMLFVGVGSTIVAVALIWMVLSALQPIPGLADEAIVAYARGVGLDHQDHTEEAIQAYDAALAAAPNYANALYERGNAHFSLDEYEEAVADYEAAIAAGRDDTNVGWNLGWTFYLLGRFEDAERVDARVLELDPSLIGVRLNLALARLANGENAAAKGDYDEAVDGAAQIVADARDAGTQPPASLWYYLDAGSLDLQNLVDRLNNQVYDWTQAPVPETIEDPDSVQRIAQDTIRQLKSATASLEATGELPGGAPTTTISPLQFAREVQDDAGNFIQYDLAEAFHYYTKKVQVLFDYENLPPGTPVTYKVYRNGYEYTSLRLTEEWPEGLGDTGAAQKPLSYAYSRLFILPAGHYDAEIYVDHQLMQRGQFTIESPGTTLSGPPGAVLFRDGFGDESFAGWANFQDEDSTREHVDGLYRIFVAQGSLTVFATPGLNFVDAVIDVDAYRSGGPDGGEMGVLCRYQDSDNFYALKATQDGYAGIYKLIDDEWSEVAAWQPTDAIVQGDEAANHLTAECVGTRLALYINGALAVEGQDADLQSGDVGLTAGTYDDPGADVRFEDFVVAQPTSAGAVLYQEDFSGTAGGWAQYADADFFADYADGGYRINVTRDTYSAWSHPGQGFTDTQIEVDATRLGGPATGEFGVICRYQDGENFYVLKITGDGYYGITKRLNGEWAVLVDWQTSDAIRQGVGASNHLRADCVGQRLALYVNDQMLAETTDDEFASGDIGLLAGTFDAAGTDILFDDLAVLQPDGAGAPVPQPVDSDVLFYDDFSDESSGWAKAEESNYSVGYSDGVYRVYLAEPNLAVWSPALQDFGDAIIEVDALKIAGPDDNNLGVMCRFRDNDNYYLLQISSGGYYGIAKRQDGAWTILGTGEFEFSEAIKQGEEINHLRADCIGDTLTLTVNGEVLSEAHDADFASGDVGLLAGSIDEGGVEVLFDDFTVRRP